MKVRTRFAPSPTGFLHLGGVRTALYGYLFAKQNGGDFILRIEDTDQERFVEGATEIIYSTLKDVGIVPDEGPLEGGACGPYVQSERKDIYMRYAKELIARGGAYYCFCDKARIESLTDENGNHRYDKHCLSLSKEEIEKNLASGMPFVIRQNVPETGTGTYTDLIYGDISVDYKEIEDGVLIKSDGMPTYNFANVVDDHLMGITHVMRGNEYLSSTPKYNLMYDAFGWERPKYIHMSQIMRDAKHKLSKRDGDAYYDDFIKKGFINKAIINYVALLGWAPEGTVEKMSMDEMIKLFSLSGLSRSPAIFDEVKMRWLNGEYIKEMDDEEFMSYARPYIDGSKIGGKGYGEEIIPSILKTRIETFGEIPQKLNFLEEFGKYDVELFTHKKMKTNPDIAREVLPRALAVMENCEFTHDALHDALIALAAEMGLKNGQVLWSVRVALSGLPETPGGAIELALLLKKERAIERMKFSIALVG